MKLARSQSEEALYEICVIMNIISSFVEILPIRRHSVQKSRKRKIPHLLLIAPLQGEGRHAQIVVLGNQKRRTIEEAVEDIGETPLDRVPTPALQEVQTAVRLEQSTSAQGESRKERAAVTEGEKARGGILRCLSRFPGKVPSLSSPATIPIHNCHYDHKFTYIGIMKTDQNVTMWYKKKCWKNNRSDAGICGGEEHEEKRTGV